MPRKNTGPRYFASKGGYYATVRGVRHCLAKGERSNPLTIETANRRYHELMLSSPSTVDGDRLTCRELFQRYLAAVSSERKATTLKMRQVVYSACDSALGSIKVRDLKPYHVTAWLAAMEQPRSHPTKGEVRWTNRTKGIAIESLKAAFNWAVDQEIISKNPIAKVKKPRVVSRSRDHLLTAEAHNRLYATANRPLKDVLLALHDTGARPGEVIQATAADFNLEIGAWVLSDHKTQRLGRSRVIYLTPKMIELTKRLATLYPSGPIFRNRLSRPWTEHALTEAFRRLRLRLGLRRISPYSYRHLFATDFLLAGGSIAILAELLGNTVAVVEHHYGHIREHGKQLRQFLIDFRSEGPPEPTGAG